MHTATITICGILLTALAVLAPDSHGESLPDNITIDSLQSLYAPVTFGHARHIERERDCAVCHHHTNGAPAAKERCLGCHRGGHEVKTMGCKSCHPSDPFSAAAVDTKYKNTQRFHEDKPGLKAAYHLGCMGCHAKKGGPTACTECHGLTTTGNAFYRSGEFAPKPGKSGKSGH